MDSQIATKYVDEMHVRIPGLENYTCTSNGNIFRVKDGKYRQLKPYNAKNGYCTIQLYGNDGKMRNHSVHTIIASAWLAKPDDKIKYVVNHINSNKRINTVENLEYITYSENALHAKQNGRGVKGRKVCQVSKDGKLIATYNSIVEASKATGIDKRTICSVCMGKRGRKTAGGYAWTYEENFTGKPTEKHGCSRPVLQYTLKGDFVERFNSVQDAADAVCCSYTNISAACSGDQKSSRGFLWKYAPKIETENNKELDTDDWIVLDEFPRYKISKNGEIYSILYKRVLRGSITEEGRKYVTITNKDKVLKTVAVHRLVAKAYLPNPENHPVVNHLNGDPSQNNVDNLEWCSYSRNSQHAYDIGLNSRKRKIDPKN